MKITVVGAIAVLAAIVAVVLLLHYLDRKQAIYCDFVPRGKCFPIFCRREGNKSPRRISLENLHRESILDKGPAPHRAL
jgi:hypothetical protein